MQLQAGSAKRRIKNVVKKIRVITVDAVVVKMIENHAAHSIGLSHSHNGCHGVEQRSGDLLMANDIAGIEPGAHGDGLIGHHTESAAPQRTESGGVGEVEPSGDALELRAGEDQIPAIEREGSSQREGVTSQIGSITFHHLSGEDRILHCGVGIIAGVVKHEDTGIGGRRGKRKLVETNGDG